MRNVPSVHFNRDNRAAIARAALDNANARRMLTWTGYGLAWMGLRAAVGTGRAIDELLYPAWRDQKVEQPVFIFANGRSGTTMLHRLMGYDEANFAGFKLYQSVFSAVSIQRFIESIGESPFSPAGQKIVERINQTFFEDTVWDGIHAMGIDKEEEDEATFVYCLESPTVSLLNPFMRNYARMTWLDAHDDGLRERFMDFYEATVKKHLYAVGGNKRFLNKNVFFAPRVRSMLERFPDARFLYLVRHPFEALPSFTSMFFEKWRTHSPELVKNSPVSRELIDMGYAYYRAGAELARTMDPERLRVVRYEDLIADPKQSVLDIYDWMQLEVSPEYDARLSAATQRQRRYKSKHDYSLADFGISEASVRRAIPDVFETFGFSS